MRRVIDVSPFGDDRPGNRSSNLTPDLPPSNFLSRRKYWFSQVRDWLSGWKEWPFWKWLGWLVAALVVLRALMWVGLLPSWDTLPGVDKDKWQAIFLNNGQVYFGRLRDVNRGYVKLNDVYYLQVSQSLQSQQASQQQPNVNLVQLGREVHGPENPMFIPKSQITFWENLRSNSPVVQAILQLKTGQ